MDKFNDLALKIEKHVKQHVLIEKVAELISEENNDIFQCSDCGEVLKTWKLAKQHVEEEHLSEEEFALISTVSFATLTYLKDKKLLDLKNKKI
jgi:hypothetical protein